MKFPTNQSNKRERERKLCNFNSKVLNYFYSIIHGFTQLLSSGLRTANGRSVTSSPELIKARTKSECRYFAGGQRVQEQAGADPDQAGECSQDVRQETVDSLVSNTSITRVSF